MLVASQHLRAMVYFNLVLPKGVFGTCLGRRYLPEVIRRRNMWGLLIELDTQSKRSPSARTLQASCHTKARLHQQRSELLDTKLLKWTQPDRSLQCDSTNKISGRTQQSRGAI